MLVLDTSILIDIEKEVIPTIKRIEELSKIYPLLPKITFITEFEFTYGLVDKNEKNKQKALSFLTNFETLFPTKKTALALATLKHKYEKRGIILSLSDLLIASITIENNYVLVTKDNDFQPIEELQKIIVS